MSNAYEPAFPIGADNSPSNEAYWGLSKRELLAAMAMQSTLASIRAASEAELPLLFSKAAEFSVRAADALLVQLDKR